MSSWDAMGISMVAGITFRTREMTRSLQAASSPECNVNGRLARYAIQGEGSTAYSTQIRVHFEKPGQALQLS